MTARGIPAAEHATRLRVGRECAVYESYATISGRSRAVTLHAATYSRWATRRNGMKRHRMIVAGIVCSVMAIFALLAIVNPAYAEECQQTVTANVVVLDQPFMWNRLGTAQPQGMIFA